MIMIMRWLYAISPSTFDYILSIFLPCIGAGLMLGIAAMFALRAHASKGK